jgi:hypothetical protein
MKCKCGKKLNWQSDFMCDEIIGCECGEGIASYWHCSECDNLYIYFTNCKSFSVDTLEEVKEGE